MQTSWDAAISKQIEKLKNHSLRDIEAEVSGKRVAWFSQQNYPRTENAAPTPREAFELFCFGYLGLAEDEVPVVKETGSEIEWLSLNPCPTLEACNKMGLDTRQVCRAAYEKSTQALISQLDPQLRFLRNYEEIRPHSPHCRERIVRVDFEAMMELAYQEALDSLREGNKGYGAVVALGQQIISKTHDTAVTERDPSLHAETKAIRQAVEVLGDTNLSGALLFSSCEPCPMCSSLAVWANLSGIVYGISIEETAKMGRSRIRVSSNGIVASSPVMVEVIGDVLIDKCRELYR